MKVIATNGCYTNNGTQNFTTSRLNRTEAVTVVEKTGDSKTGPMSATHSSQLAVQHHVHSIQKQLTTS